MPRGGTGRVFKISHGESTVRGLLPSWERSLVAANLSAATQLNYAGAVRRFADWLAASGRSELAADVDKATIEEYVAALLRTLRPSSADTYLRDLRRFLSWCEAEGEMARNPAAGVRRPMIPPSAPRMLTEEQLRALMRTCEGGDFIARRDAAILRVLIDCGLRRSEIAGLTLNHVDLQARELTVLGKFRRERVVVMRPKTVAAIDRYLRVRGRHRAAESDALWLGQRGALGGDGIYETVRFRARQAGIPDAVWPHLLRHGYAHAWLEEGGSETGLMRQAGWKTRAMLDRYGAALAEERAREEAKHLRLGDRI